MATQVMGGAPGLRRNFTAMLPAGAGQAVPRLTGRGRVLLAVLLMLIGVLVVGAAADVPAVSSRSAISSGAAPGAAAPGPVHVVAAGDSLWAIASRLAPDSDPRALVFEIRRLNGLAGADLRVGQVLRLPGTGDGAVMVAPAGS